ncbi:MAG: hypothetical protein AB1726_17165 [Planctomycetota bacterium]
MSRSSGRVPSAHRGPGVPRGEKWISISPNVWHQGVVSGADWVVVSSHTAADDELIEERPAPGALGATHRRTYTTESGTGGSGAGTN